MCCRVSDCANRSTRRNLENDIFLHTKSNPFLLIELKGREINLTENSPSYKATVNQLKRQLLGNNCKAAQWGIINNSSHIQLFRKHGKTIFPATTCIELTPENIDDTIALIKTKIDSTPKALTVTVYNNKGGIGKTTTASIVYPVKVSLRTTLKCYQNIFW